MKQRISNFSFRRIWIPIIAVLSGLCLLATVAMNLLSDLMDDYLGRGERIDSIVGEAVSYYDKATDDRKVSAENSYKTALEVQKEGSVLLRNNGVLPLAEKSVVTPFGYRYKEPIYGQIGSGSAKWAVDPVTPEKGLEGSLTVNKSAADRMNGTPKALAEANGTLFAGDVAGSLMGGDSLIYEYDPSIYDGISGANGSVGLVFIARAGQEGSDKKYDGYEDGTPHYCAFTQNELGTIKRAKELCGKVVVIVEASTAMEYAPVVTPGSEYEADALLLVGHVGERGFSALGDILTGKVNPSGRTVDIHATDFTLDPTYKNFGEFKYANVKDKPYYIEYQEDVYLGYRFYETADEVDESFVYGELNADGSVKTAGSVVYPFGYGLSYTDFTEEITDFKTDGDEISVTVKVTNDGERAGKDVVEIYYSAPYTAEFDGANDIEKPSVVLAAFAKTKELAKGASDTLTLTFEKEDMASYCSGHDNGNGTKGAYVLSSGDYKISLRKNSHEVVDERIYNNPDVVWFDGSDDAHIRRSEKEGQSGMNADGSFKSEPKNGDKYVAASNLFDDVTNYMKEESDTLTRKNWKSTFPKGNSRTGKNVSDKVKATFDKETTFDVNSDPELGNVEGSKWYTTEMPEEGKDNGLVLSHMRGLDYGDDKWEAFLDQIDYEGDKSDIIKLLTAANYSTKEVNSLGLPQTLEADGANGIKKIKTDAGMKLTATYGYAPLIAQTWNIELCYEVGAQFGQESLTVGVNGWYSPAINLHRSPFSGRNFEYYSEDPLLTGKIAAAVVSGAGDNGLVCYIKHFAVNDQETRRAEYLHTWASEQTMRELYFKAFEIPVKEAKMTIRFTDSDGKISEKTMRGATALMCAQNDIGSTISHANYELIYGLLRGEWGFDGLVLTDMYSETAKGHKDFTLRGGSDCFLGMEILSGLVDYDSATARTRIREALHHICFTFANANVLAESTPGSTATYAMSPWRICLIVANAVIWLFVAFITVMLVLRWLDEKKHPENYLPVPAKKKGKKAE